MNSSRGGCLQVSQSELDLEKFAASILLDDGPMPAGEALGHARTSDSSLQGSNSGWEAMPVDNLSIETTAPGSMPEQGTTFGIASASTPSQTCACSPGLDVCGKLPSIDGLPGVHELQPLRGAAWKDLWILSD